MPTTWVKSSGQRWPWWYQHKCSGSSRMSTSRGSFSPNSREQSPFGKMLFTTMLYLALYHLNWMGKSDRSVLARSLHHFLITSSCSSWVLKITPLAKTLGWSSGSSHGMTRTVGFLIFARASARSKGFTAVPVSQGSAAVVMMVKCRPGLRRSEASVHLGIGPRENSGDSASASSKEPPNCCTIRAPLRPEASDFLAASRFPLRCWLKAVSDNKEPTRPLTTEMSCWSVQGSSSPLRFSTSALPSCLPADKPTSSSEAAKATRARPL
mmetsp:Transcript_93030/g.208232  ORF Transcript_93030/g.208232 Transcript_93030/m.208232 type:complete len:267 (+) Transcript_93030:46-846(+)